MNAGKAIYYLLSNASSVTDICGTRIYPELAEQEAPTPFVVYEVISVDPDDTNDGPAKLDEVTVDITAVADVYDTCADLASAIRAAIDRIRGTYNGVNVDSVQYSTTDTDVMDSPRRYAMTAKYIVRISRDLAQIATGQPIDLLTILRLADTPSTYGTTGQALVMNAAGDALEWGETASALGDLTDVSLDDPHDREALVYDEATQAWINDGIGKVVIPIFNTTYEDILPGRPLQAAGSQGDRIAVEPWDGSKSGLQYVGNAETLIPARSNGHALVYGEIRGLNTSQWPVGQLLQLSGINPSFAPFGMRYYADGFSDQPFVSAMVTRSHENTGRIFVRMWSPGYRPRLESLDDVEADNPYLGATLYWTGQDWRYRPQTSKFIVDFAQDLTEIYYYATPLDAQEYRTPRSDTPSEGNKIVRKIWYTPTAQANIDTADWILLETLEDNALYSDVISAFTAALNTSPGGDTPISIKTTWEEVPAFTGLLDTYPGAAAAYSLRLLDADYSGSAINVRRASDNAVQDIGFTASGDLDTSALATFCAGTDGFAVRWYDQSGNANDAVQATTSAQPKVYDSVTGVILDNGKPALRLNGAESMLFNVVTLETDYAMITVNHADVTGAGLCYLGSNTSARPVWNELANGTLDMKNGVAFGDIIVSNFITFDQHLIFINSSNGSVIASSDGNATTVGSVPGAWNWRQLFKYAFANYNGYSQEIIFYPSDQSANRTGIESNINTYYSIY